MWVTCGQLDMRWFLNISHFSARLAGKERRLEDYKTEMMNNFAWAAIMLFRISGASQAYFGSLKGCYQRRYYCRERLYSQISLKV